MKKVETLILENLIFNPDYSKQVIPFLDGSYFHNPAEREIFSEIQKFYGKYNAVPNITALEVEIESKKMSESLYNDIKGTIESFEREVITDQDWLMETSEKFCKDKAIYNAIMKSIQIIDGDDKELTKEALPGLLQEALAVSFDKSVGHDFFEDVEDRYDFMHKVENKIRFDLEMFNKITRGGIPPKTLNVVLASTNVGKSLFLCHLAAAYIRAGFDVLYITLEMAEEKIAERIDCNLLDVGLDVLEKMGKAHFINGINGIQQKTHGKLIIKEYPNSSAHAGHFRALLDELETKKNFKPKVILVDYLNICASQRANRNDNSYTIVKKIAEELRALAQEYNVPVWSATQTNRGGANNSDVAITDTSESFGLPMTVDFMFAMVRGEELDALGQVMCIQLKSRYNRVDVFRKFVIGVDIMKFKFFDVDQVAQNDVVDDGPVFDKGKFGSEMKQRGDSGFNFD